MTRNQLLTYIQCKWVRVMCGSFYKLLCTLTMQDGNNSARNPYQYILNESLMASVQSVAFLWLMLRGNYKHIRRSIFTESHKATEAELHDSQFRITLSILYWASVLPLSCSRFSAFPSALKPNVFWVVVPHQQNFWTWCGRGSCAHWQNHVRDVQHNSVCLKQSS